MSYIGSTPTTQAFSPAVDIFSGNGSATVLSLSKPVLSAAQVQVVVNNVPQNPASAFTVGSQTITFTSAPSSGTNNIYVYYVSPITQAIAPSQGTVTTSSLNSAFLLPVTNISASGSPSASTFLRGDSSWATVPQIQPISASIASSALTITASALTLDFRSTTLGSGTVTTVSGTPASLVVPSTATLGTVNAVQSRLVVVALNNAGTIELAVVNISGGNNLDETTLLTTTAISASSTSASTVYSTTARTSLAFRVIGYIESTQATAGTWATAPSTIQGYGGQALSAMSSLGYGQTWQTVTRTSGTTYYNTTGKPIVANRSFTAFSNAVSRCTVSINGGTGFYILATEGNSTTARADAAGSVIIPPNASYVFTDDGTPGTVTTTELR
jgi:hypothetical protein